MADSKLSALTSGNPILSSDEFLIARGGASYKVSGFGSMALQGASSITVTGGTISGLTSLSTAGDLEVGGSIISSSDGDITITPDGTGSIILDGLSWPQSDGIANYVLQTDGSGQLSWAENAGGGGGDLVDDLTPQLGGMLDVNGFAIGDGVRELLTFSETGSAVNHVDILNAATGSGPWLRAIGDDANVDLNANAKGTGSVILRTNNSERLRASASGIRLSATGATVNEIKDEDDMSSDSATALATQQSIKAYVDNSISAVELVDDASPQLGGMLDVNGNAIGDGTRELLTFSESGTAVNNVQIGNAATSTAPTISAVGDDTNVSLSISSKGSGSLTLTSNTFTASVNSTGLQLGSGAIVSNVLDEDDMSSDSDGALATQQSIKAYVDANAAGDWVLLDSATASGDSAVEFTGFSSSHSAYKIIISNVQLSIAGYFQARFSDDGGSTWESGSSDYGYQFCQANGTGVAAVSSVSSNSMRITPSLAGSGSDGEISGELTIYNPSDSGHETQMTGFIVGAWVAVQPATVSIGAQYHTASAIDGIQILGNGGTISGEFRLYGLANS